MIEVQQSATLAHPTTHVQYDFRPQDGPTVLIITVVEVVRTAPRWRDTYLLPAEEARQLWVKLVHKGYERF